MSETEREMTERRMIEYLSATMEDNDEMWYIKEAVRSLNELQRKIFLQYIDCGTYTGVAKAYGVSVPCAKAYVCKVRGKVIEWIAERVI